MAEASTSRGADGESKAMLDIATPDLYRVNAFRVLGLSVDVSSSDLSKQQKKMKMLGKLGEGAARAQQAILPLDPPPNVDAIQKAGQQLHDPELRLVHELFWFWPIGDAAEGKDDSGLVLLRNGNTQGACTLWSGVATNSPAWSRANHNLAVLHHAIALDMEHAMDGRQQPDPQSVARRDKHWQAALRHWAAVADDEAVWDRVASRIRELDDPRLTTGVSRRLRRTLPTVVLTISIRLAVRSANDADAALRHLSYVHDSGLDSSLAAAIRDRVVAPLVDQVKQICEPVSARSKADPEHADVLAQQVMSDTKPLLSKISAILDEDHHLRQSAFDAVAATVRDCRQRKEYENLKRAVTSNHIYEVTLTQGHAYLELAETLGAMKVPGEGRGFRASVPKVCACCFGEPDDEQSVSHEWEETRGLTRYKRSLSFSFPVCRACTQHQSEYSRRQWLLALLSAGGSIGIGYLIATQMSAVDWLPFVLVGGVLTGTLLLVCSSFIRLSILGDEHACRDVAVEMSSASDAHASFRFHNPLYADAFAKANHATVKPHSYLKPPRGSYLLRGRPAIFVILASLILGGIGHSIIYASIQDERKPSSAAPRRDYSPRATENRRPSPPSDSYVPPRPRPPSYSYTGLASKIESGRARATLLEGEIERMDKQLETLSSVLTVYKNQIDGYEGQTRLGRRVDQAAYELAIRNHNSAVSRYNAILADRKAKYAEYSRETESVNDMVRRFNGGER